MLLSKNRKVRYIFDSLNRMLFNSFEKSEKKQNFVSSFSFIFLMSTGGCDGRGPEHDDEDDRVQEEVQEQVHLGIQPGQPQLRILLR